MKLIISEDDIAEVIGRGSSELLRTNKKIELLGGDDDQKEKTVYNAILKVITKRLTKIIPDDFQLEEIEVEINVEGKPFGVGIGGNVVAKFVKTE